MSPKKPRPPPTSSTQQKPPSKKQRILSDNDQRALNVTHGRDALKAYTLSPTSFPPSRVISHDDDFVVINDLFPKSSVHLLLLPRDPAKQLQHPFDALDGSDPAFLASVQRAALALEQLAASELRRRFAKASAAERARRAALERDHVVDDSAARPPLPPGKDWRASVVSGIHAHPSMTRLHIHVLSTDRVSACVTHSRHYNSFATPFFVPVADFPLAPHDPRRHPGREGYLDRELQCERCGRGFGNRFKKLKAHLAEEFEAWKAE